MLEFLAVRIHIIGVVQEVRFLPFFYNLATELGLCGWVPNSSSGISMEAVGPAVEALPRQWLRWGGKGTSGGRYEV
jgi:acylphosphatase